MFGEPHRAEHAVEIGGSGRRGWLQLMPNLLDQLLQIGVMARRRRRALKVFERELKLATAAMNIRQRAERGEIVRRERQCVLELVLPFVESAELDQGAPECDAGGRIGGMAVEPGTANLLGGLVVTRTAMLFGELRKRDGRWIRVEAAAQFPDACTVGSHGLWVILSGAHEVRAPTTPWREKALTQDAVRIPRQRLGTPPISRRNPQGFGTTVTSAEVTAVCPASSSTLSSTLYVPGVL